ncbi:MAG: DPP IV N-terminal domain-containing protein [Phycisphaerales bacterium]|nr:DPP IV N-terminal domain-containing protein [Phycisphaerales bacterium]
MKRLVPLIALACSLCLAFPRLGRGQELQTTAERSGYAQTSTYEDVETFVKALAGSSALVHLDELGTTSQGRSIPMLVISDPGVSTPEEARASGKLVALLIGNIHAGEVCGKEALQMLARELATTPEHPLLKDYVVCLVPIYNADGNEQMDPGNRPGQVGPETMGVRQNAQGFDLNRDFIKAEAPETRALLRAFRRWNPDVFIDTHTTDGSHHGYVLTYSGPKHPGGDVALLKYERDTMLPRITNTLKETKGHETFPYGNFEAEHTQWTTFPASPRYSTNYFGMRNRIAVLSEAYSYATFEERVVATLDFCRAVLEDCAAHKDELRSMFREADERASKGSGVTEPTPVRTAPAAMPEKATALGFVEEERDGHRVATDQPRDYQVDVIDNFVATASVERPWGYVIPAARTDVVELLQRHGVTVEVVREDSELDAQVYPFESVERMPQPFQGHAMVTAKVAAAAKAEGVRAGDFLVRVGQPLGNLVVATLEPEAEDSLVTWNFFDDAARAGGEYPVWRVPGETPLLTSTLPALPEDRGAKKRITYEALYESRDRPNLGGSPMRGVSWKDDEHYVVSRGRDRWVVEAATGRYVEKEAGQDNDAIVKAIAGLESFDEKAAGQIGGRRAFADTAGGNAIFESGDDLYAVALDGSWARRLTSSPEREELASLSPDGRYAAYVRSNDLYTVEVSTGIERRLTTTGSEKVRNGKNAWIYYEEIFNRDWKSYWWAPDSSAIAYFETNSEDVDTFTLVDDSVEPQRVEVTEYPKPGRPNPELRLGVVSPSGGEPGFVDLSGYTRGGFVVSSMGWWPDSSRVYFTIQDRVQSWLDLCTASPRGGVVTKLLRDRTEAWIEAPAYFRVLDDGSFLLSSERSGWQQVYRYDKEGKLLGQVTDGAWEFRGEALLDTEKGTLFFNCTADSPIGSSLYAVNLDGSNQRQLTKERGSHRVDVSPGGKYFVDTWSNTDQPDQCVLRDAEGNRVRMLDTNPVYELQDWDVGRVELVRIPASRSTDHEQIMLEGMIVYPPDFDPGKKYPVWYSTYAGPHAPTIGDSWSGGRVGDHMLATSGFIVFHGDPYSASGKGARSAWTAYKQLGRPEMEDINDMMNWLKTKPFIDGTRIGMSGFSYGGFMTSYAMTHSDQFAAGIAGGSVTSWRDYDSIYTERYMLTPQENPEGYDGTSVAAAAKNLHGRMLLIHGWMDDNVHPQNSQKLIQAMIEADKDFEMLLYPRFRHGIYNNHYRRVNYEFQMRLVHQGEGAASPPSEGSVQPAQPRAEGPRGRRRNRDGASQPAPASDR